MKKTVFSLIFCSMAMGAFAQQPLGGFLYGTEVAPMGTEWEAPEKLSLNKEQPHAYFFSFNDVESALKVLPQHSRYWQNLNGTWKFHWAPNPDERPKSFYETGFDVSGWDDITVPSCWNVVGIQKDGSLKYGVPIYCNQPNRTRTGLPTNTGTRWDLTAVPSPWPTTGKTVRYTSISTE